MINNSLTIKNKVKDFIKKYYFNELYKGFFLFILITLLVFLSYSLLEYFSYLGTTMRSFLFYTYIVLFTGTLIKFILIPIFKLLGFGKQLTNKQVAQIIGNHFPEIDDKLLNLFELEEIANQGNYKSYDLLMAAIETKEQKIKPFSFIKAIPFKKNLKYVKWALIPVFLFILIISIKSEIITESTSRIVNYDTRYTPPAPYSFQIINDKLSSFQNNDFLVQIKVIGDETPDNLYIQYGKKTYKCNKISNTQFSYQFTNLQNDVDFILQTDEVASPTYTLKVLPKPLLISYIMELYYPAYLNKNHEVIENNGDATIPEGTRIVWKFYTKNTENVNFIFHNNSINLTKQEDVYTYSSVIKESFDYYIVNKNNFIVNKDTLFHSLFVIKDLYPEIYVQSQKDSLFADRVYFKGSIKDDYGFSSLYFVYSKYNDKDELLEDNIKIPITIIKQNSIQNFYFYFDAALLNLSAGNKISYHFEVFDNDGVNGPKMAKSEKVNFKLKTLEEIEKELTQSNTQTKKEIQSVIKESHELMKEIDNLSKQLLQKDNPTWQDKQKMQALIDKYNQLKEQIQNIKDDQQLNQQIEEQYKNNTEEILKKQEELQKRYDDILSDEMKSMIEKLQQMMQEANKDKMQEVMQQMKNKTEDINKSLDQQLQLFKHLEYEKKFEELLSGLRQLSEEQKNLSLQTQRKDISKETLQKQQNELNKKFQHIDNQIQELKQLNQSLEEPNKFDDHQQDRQQIKDSQQDASNSIDKNQRNKAQQSQQSAADKIKKLADNMEQQMNEESLEDINEDIETLRQILDNLVQVSFKQESNLNNVSKLSARSPAIGDYIKQQIVIQDLTKLINDSLQALGRRQTEVKSFILSESKKIKDYHSLVMEQLKNRQLKQAVSNQQFALTSMNNLALMLAESMKAMKKKQSECKGNCKKSGGKSSSSKPGSSKSKAKSARELQQQLNRQIESLKRSMEQGDKPQGQQGQGQQSLSEQFAKMAAQQEAIRRMMQEYQNDMKSQNGVGDKTLEQLLKEMEQTERDLVNRTITQQTVNRQKNIETRMLESERAQQEKEKEQKRESIEARQKPNPTPPAEWNFDKQNIQQIEMMKTVPPSLNYYYKEKVNQYFFNIQ